jgi:hypothetical protein
VQRGAQEAVRGEGQGGAAGVQEAAAWRRLRRACCAKHAPAVSCGCNTQRVPAQRRQAAFSLAKPPTSGSATRRSITSSAGAWEREGGVLSLAAPSSCTIWQAYPGPQRCLLPQPCPRLQQPPRPRTLHDTCLGIRERAACNQKARGCLEPVPGARSSGGSGLRVLSGSAFCSGGDGASHLSRQSTGLLRGTPSQRGTLPHMLPCFAPLLLTGSACRGPRRLPAPGSCIRRCGTRAAAAS